MHWLWSLYLKCFLHSWGYGVKTFPEKPGCPITWKTWHGSVAKGGLPWWSTGWESAFQCRGHRFDPGRGICSKCLGNDTHVLQALSPRALGPVLHKEVLVPQERSCCCNRDPARRLVKSPARCERRDSPGGQGEGLWGAAGRAWQGAEKTHFGVVLHLRSQQFEVDAAKLPIPSLRWALWRRGKKAGSILFKELQVEKTYSWDVFLKKNLFCFPSIEKITYISLLKSGKYKKGHTQSKCIFGLTTETIMGKCTRVEKVKDRQDQRLEYKIQN